MNLTTTLEKIINYAAHVAEPEKIILFGSMLNGNANVYSDVDLLIITSYIIDKKETVTRIKSHSNQWSLKTDVLIYTKSELENELKMQNSFVAAIYKHGKIVYKKPADFFGEIKNYNNFISRSNLNIKY
jgi:predicted nucleotidyltransferase